MLENVEMILLEELMFLSLDKDIAVLKIYEENWHGYNFTDYFTCWKENDTWKIVTKAYTPVEFKK